MPLVRKVISVGNARGMTFPKSWLEDLERKSGKKLKKVAIRIDEDLIVSPYFETKKLKGAP